MQIICPNCAYTKQVDPALLPADATRVSCPKCEETFDLPGMSEPAKEAPQEAAAPEDPAVVAPAAQQTMKSAGHLAAESFPKAGFWLRVVAALLDIMIVFMLQFVLGLLLTVTGLATEGGGPGQLGGLVLLFSYSLNFAYYIVFTGNCGQTPGKMALRIKVIRCDGQRIGYGKAAFREVIGKFLSGIILGIGYLMVAFDEQKRGLHDRIADTYVVKL